MIITAAEILACHPCSGYSAERIRALVGAGLTPAQVAALEIPRADRVWCLTEVLARRNRKALVRWAIGCAQDVLHLITDKSTRDAAECAIGTAAAWCEGAATSEDCWDAAAAARADAAANAAAADYADYAAIAADYAARAADYAARAAVDAAVAAAAADYAARAAVDAAVDAAVAAAETHQLAALVAAFEEPQ